MSFEKLFQVVLALFSFAYQIIISEIVQELEDEVLAALEKINGIKDIVSRNHMKVYVVVFVYFKYGGVCFVIILPAVDLDSQNLSCI